MISLSLSLLLCLPVKQDQGEPSAGLEEQEYNQGDRGELQQLSDGEGGEELRSEGVGVQGEAVVDEGGAEPEVVADQGLLPQVRPDEQLQKREGRFLSHGSPCGRNEAEVAW